MVLLTNVTIDIDEGGENEQDRTNVPCYGPLTATPNNFADQKIKTDVTFQTCNEYGCLQAQYIK